MDETGEPMKYKAIIFDLDGTLLNTIQDIAGSMNAVLGKNGYPVHTLKRYKYLVGLGLEKLVYDSLPETARKKSILKRMKSEAGKEYAIRWNHKSRPYPGIVSLLKTLKSRVLKTAVLSNKPQHFTKKSVEALLPYQCIDLIQGEDSRTRKKPDPQGALKISKVFRISPRNIIYVGDTKTDMQTAKAAKMFAVGVTWGFRSKAELLSHGADSIINHPRELLKYFAWGTLPRPGIRKTSR